MMIAPGEGGIDARSDRRHRSTVAEATSCQRVAPPCSRAVRALSALSALCPFLYERRDQLRAESNAPMSGVGSLRASLPASPGPINHFGRDPLGPPRLRLTELLGELRECHGRLARIAVDF